MGLFKKPAKRRAKVFGQGTCVPLDRNAKVRVWVAALAYTKRSKQPGQQSGPLTRAFLDVLKSLLWAFHNQHTGRCFPGYERIAEAARVSRATVARAIAALEVAGIITWENRLVRTKIWGPGLLGPVSRIVPRRTSNSYQFIDPRPKSQKQTGTPYQDILYLDAKKIPHTKVINSPLEAALMRLGSAIAKKGDVQNV